MKYTDIKVYGDVYVSSSFHYFADVRYKENGKWRNRNVCLNDSSVKYKNGGGYLEMPAYFNRELENQIVVLLTDPTTRFHEYDRDGNKRYEDLRYYDAEYVAVMAGRKAA